MLATMRIWILHLQNYHGTPVPKGAVSADFSELYKCLSKGTDEGREKLLSQSRSNIYFLVSDGHMQRCLSQSCLTQPIQIMLQLQTTSKEMLVLVY